MIEFDTINKISPTPGWMSETYDKLNDWLFGGRLGQCDFSVFTKGKGSTGNRLGFFHLVNKSPYHHLKYKKSSRRIFLLDTISQQELFVNYDNFYDLCHPEICLNGNYCCMCYTLWWKTKNENNIYHMVLCVDCIGIV